MCLGAKFNSLLKGEVIMTLNDEIKILDEKFKKLNVPFDKGLPILQDLVWEVADRYNTTGPEVLKLYFDWKSEEEKKEN